MEKYQIHVLSDEEIKARLQVRVKVTSQMLADAMDSPHLQDRVFASIAYSSAEVELRQRRSDALFLGAVRIPARLCLPRDKIKEAVTLGREYIKDWRDLKEVVEKNP